MKRGFKLEKSIGFKFFKSESFSTGLGKVTQSLSGKYLNIASLIKLDSDDFPILFIRQLSKNSFEDMSFPVFESILFSEKSLNAQINLGENSVINASLSNFA
jgi:hypothetical protein